MPRVLATIHLANPRPGQWCNRCLLPSGIEWDVYILIDTGISNSGTWPYCPDCNQPIRCTHSEAA